MAAKNAKSRAGQVLEGILADELKRQEELLERAMQRVQALPAGSLQLKERRKRRYAYLAARDKGRVRYHYLGPEDSEEVEEVRKRIEERRQLEREARRYREAIRDIRKRFRV